MLGEVKSWNPLSSFHVVEVMNKVSARINSEKRIDYLIVALALTAIAVKSLHRHGYITGGDIWPGIYFPNNSVYTDSQKIWGNSMGALGSPQFSPLFVVLGSWTALLTKLGASGPTSQFLLLWVLLVWQGLGTTYLLRGLCPNARVEAIVAGLALPLSLFNALFFTNTVQAFAIGFFAFVPGLILRRFRHSVAPLRFGAELGICSLGLMVLVATPPLAIYFILWSIYWTIVAAIWFRPSSPVLLALLTGTLFGTAANAWWIFSAYVTLFQTSGAAQQSFGTALAWRWVDSRASLQNLISMQGYWAWPRPEYYPWADPYVKGLLRYLIYVPVIFASIGVVSRVREKVVWPLLGSILFSLALAKGSHPPFQAANLSMYLHVPLFWLFRDPQTEADVSLYISMFVLSGIGIGYVVRLTSKFLKRWLGRPVTLSTVLIGSFLCALMCSSGWAILSGGFIPNQWLLGKASLVVNLPRYWYKASEFLNQQADDARVLILPNDDYYQMLYSWGYYGADGMAFALLRRPVLNLAPVPSGYIASSKPFLDFEQELLRDMRLHRDLSIAPVLRTLGVGWIIQRNDIEWALPGRNILDPQHVRTFLSQQRGITLVRRFGQLDVYRVSGARAMVSAYDGFVSWDRSQTLDLPSADALFQHSVPWVLAQMLPKQNSLVKGHGFKAILGPEGRIVRRTPVAGRLSLRPISLGIDVTKVSDRRLQLRLIGPTLNAGASSIRWEKLVFLNFSQSSGEDFILTVGRNDFLLPRGSLVIGKPHRAGTYIPDKDNNQVNVALSSYGGDIAANASWSPVHDCAKVDSKSASEVALNTVVDSKQVVKLSAKAHAACVFFNVNIPKATRHLLATLRYRHELGQNPAVALLLDKSRVVHSELQGTKTVGIWQHRLDVEKSHNIGFYVYANTSPKEGPTINVYERPSLLPIRTIATAHFNVDNIVKPVMGGKLSLSAASPSDSRSVLRDPSFKQGLWSAPFDAFVSPRWQGSSSALKALVLKNGTLDMSASHDGIGESQTLNSANGSILRISIRARTLRGDAPVAKLFSPLSNTTIWQSNFSSNTHEWQRATEDVLVGDEYDDAELILYGYASETPTHVQFNSITLRKWPAGMGELVWVGGNVPEQIPIKWRQAPGQTFEAEVPERARVLVVPYSFDQGWKVQTFAAGLPWIHIPVDGFLNGWIIPTRSSGQRITIYYEPAKLYRYLQWLSISAMGVLIITFLTQVFRSNRGLRRSV